MADSPTPPAPLQLLSYVNTSANTTLSCLGIVCDFLEPSHTRGDDMQQTFRLIDHSLTSTSTTYASSTSSPNAASYLRVKFFCKRTEDFPPIRAVGDVILLRNVNVRLYQGQVVALASRRTTWTVFPGDQIPSNKVRLEGMNVKSVPAVKHVNAPPPSLDEARYAVALRRYIATSTGLEFTKPVASLPVTSASKGGNAVAVTAAPREKFALIRDIKPNQFHDLAVRVLKKYPSDFNNIELYVTDYTSNKALYNYPDDPQQRDTQSESFPPGCLTLKVDLMPPHSQWAEMNVRQNDFVLLRNVRIKDSKNGQLEGNMWHDNLNSQRIHISSLDKSHPRAHDLFARRKAHDVDMQRKSLGIGTSKKGRNKNASKHALDNTPVSADANNAKKIKFSKEFELNQSIQVTTQNKTTDKPVPLSEIVNFDRTTTTPKGRTYTLPFVNFRAYTNVRVVDYYPHDLKDFAVPVPVAIHSHDMDYATDMDYDSGAQREKWDWHFTLLLEEATTDTNAPPSTSTIKPVQLPVLVAGADAQFLLNLDAADLSQNPEILHTLRERLFLLWGDLEERKSALLNSLHTSTPSAEKLNPKKHVLPQPHGTSLWPIDILTTPEAQEALQRSGLEKLGTGSRPFTCCIGEYGIRDRAWTCQGNENEEGGDVSEDEGYGEGGGGGSDGEGSKMHVDGQRGEDVDVAGDVNAWIRVHRLFGTTIRF